MNKKALVIVIVIIVLVALGLWWFRASAPAPAPAPGGQAGAPAAEDSFVQEVDSLNLGDLDSEFQEIDQDLQTL